MAKSNPEVDIAWELVKVLDEKAQRTIKRRLGAYLNKLEADRITAEVGGKLVTLEGFDDAMSRFVAGYERPVGLTASAIVQCHRIFTTLRLTPARAAMIAEWYSTQEWFCQQPNQIRAIANLGKDILTAERWQEYKRYNEQRLELLCDANQARITDEQDRGRPGQRTLPGMAETTGEQSDGDT